MNDKLAKHVVFSGLSASGKTTIVRSLGEDPSVAIVPEHNDWIGGSHNFPKKPETKEEKISKQEFFLNIDLERHNWVQKNMNDVTLLISDADFTSPLAHNYAERWLYPGMDVYAWMVTKYCELLEKGQLKPADFYIYLDTTLPEREERRAQEYAQRKRNDMFFNGRFPDDMRHFYWVLMHPDSPRAALPCHWHRHKSQAGVEEVKIRETLDQRGKGPTPTIDISKLVQTLRSTIDDEKDWNLVGPNS